MAGFYAGVHRHGAAGPVRPPRDIGALRACAVAFVVGLISCVLCVAAVAVVVAAGALIGPSQAAAAPRSKALAHPDAAVSQSGQQGYSLATTKGALIGEGGALGTPAPGAINAPVVGTAATPDEQGAWEVASDGGIFSHGDATFFGSAGALRLVKPVVGMAAARDGQGYWLVASDGGVFSFGDAVFKGSMGGIALARPMVGMAGDPATGGYWTVASDGGVFSFGAPFYGSTGAIHLKQPIVGMAATPDGLGYWLVASDGGIFTFGDAAFYGSTGAIRLDKPVVGMAATPDGKGYWLVASDGGIFTFGDAPFAGSAQPLGQQVVGMAPGIGGYENPLRAVSNLDPLRIDQGVDYGGSGPIYALGDGVVLNTNNDGWPGEAFISYRLEDGRAAGDIVYVAENVVPAVSVGEQVTPNTVVGTLINAYPDLETGWAASPGSGNTEAMATGQWNANDDKNSVPTAYGENFSQLLASLGAPAGQSLHSPSGALAPGWPGW